jgi:hypothetical protein
MRGWHWRWVLGVVVATAVAMLLYRGTEPALPTPAARETAAAASPEPLAAHDASRVAPPPPAPHPAAAPQRAVAAWIRGRVVDASTRAPIEGASLRLTTATATPSPSPRTTARTGPDGRFDIDGPVRGDARFEVLAAGHDQRTLRIGGMEPQLDLGDVPLTRTTVANLRVVEEGGRPVPGAAVFWRACPPVVMPGATAARADVVPTFQSDQPTAVTDADGIAVLPEATFGVHRLLVAKDGFRCHLRDVPILVDVAADLGTVTLEPASATGLALVREDGGPLHGARIHQAIDGSITLVQTVPLDAIQIAAPPTGTKWSIAAYADQADGSFFGNADDPGATKLVLKQTVPSAGVAWSPVAAPDHPVSLWCFAVQRGSLWQQAQAQVSVAAGSWHCWPRRGPDLRFVAWSPLQGLGLADATIAKRGARVAATPTLAWRALPQRSLAIVATDGTPAAGALVVGEIELTEAVLGTPIGGSQPPRAPLARTADAGGIADLGAVGGCRVRATVTLAGHAPAQVVVEPNATERIRVDLARGGTIITRVAAPPDLHASLRIGIRSRNGPPRWFPVTAPELRLAGLEPGPADVLLECGSPATAALQPPVFDVRATAIAGTTVELDRTAVVVGTEPVWADLVAARGPLAELTIEAPHALRVAVTPLSSTSLPTQRAFVGTRTSPTIRVCGMFDGPWLVELLDADLRTVWWREVAVSRTPQQLRATLPASALRCSGAPSEAAGTCSATLRDGRSLSWLDYPLRITSGIATTLVPDGTYRTSLRTPDGPWHGVVRVNGDEATLQPTR